MKRREFLTASAAVGLALGTSPWSSSVAHTAGRQLIEMRLYHFASAAKLDAFNQFMSRATIPALHRAGVGPVGVFRLMKADNPNLKLESDSLDLYVMLPHSSPDSCILLTERLAADQTFVDAGQEVIDAPKSDPAYLRYESSLFLAFSSVPKVEVPTKAASRVQQLRIYESHSTERGLKKIEMFNEGGEVAIFRRCGLDPVLFGQALVGDKLPNLTYMLSFKDEAAMKKAWDAFRGDPEWTKLRKDPAYKDTVSNITNLILRPASCSEI